MSKVELTSQELDSLIRILMEKMRSITSSKITPQEMRHLYTKLTSFVEEDRKERTKENNLIGRNRMAAED